VEETLESVVSITICLLETPRPVRAISRVSFCPSKLVEGVPGKIRSIGRRNPKAFPRFLTPAQFCGFGSEPARESGSGAEKEIRVADALAAGLSDLRQEKQSFPWVLQGFPAKLALSPRERWSRMPYTASEHADDAAAAPIRKLGRNFGTP